MPSTGDPNFPSGLDIEPLATTTSESDVRFDATAQAGAIRAYGIAGRIWEASHAMLAYLDPSSSSTLDFDPPPFTPRVLPPSASHPITAIELGSGNGFLAARVAEWLRPDLDLLVATDLPDVCPLLQANLASCRSTVTVRPLAWGSREHAHAIHEDLCITSPLKATQTSESIRRPSHIICSDLIYFPALLAPLLRSLLHLTSPPAGPAPCAWQTPPVIISYKIRSLAKESPFWSVFGLWFEYVPVLARGKGFRLDDSPIEDLEGWARFSPGDETFVFVATRRQQSLSWTVPDSDAALLRGVGAYDSTLPKSDDQFEQLLLMGMDV